MEMDVKEYESDPDAEVFEAGNDEMSCMHARLATAGVNSLPSTNV